MCCSRSSRCGRSSRKSNIRQTYDAYVAHLDGGASKQIPEVTQTPRSSMSLEPPSYETIAATPRPKASSKKSSWFWSSSNNSSKAELLLPAANEKKSDKTDDNFEEFEAQVMSYAREYVERQRSLRQN